MGDLIPVGRYTSGSSFTAVYGEGLAVQSLVSSAISVPRLGGYSTVQYGTRICPAKVLQLLKASEVLYGSADHKLHGLML